MNWVYLVSEGKGLIESSFLKSLEFDAPAEQTDADLWMYASGGQIWG